MDTDNTTLISDIQKQIDSIAEQAEYDFSSDKSAKYKSQVLNYIKQIDSLLSDESALSKQNKVKLNYIKGKAYDILPEYSKMAEESLTKAIKLTPNDPDTLITLGHILWKKQDFTGSKQCFETIIEQNPKNIKALRFLSIVLRQLDENKAQNISKSVEIAKQALMLDLKDGYSWYIMGNAYMSDYFANIKKSSEQLDLALKAFNQSEKLQKYLNPDLYYNRGNVNFYFENYQQGIEDYKKANQIDPSLGMNIVEQQISKLRMVKELLDTKCKISVKKLQNIIKQIPIGLKSQPKHLGNQTFQITFLEQLVEGKNDGVILACKSLAYYTKVQDIPAGFVIIDNKGALSTLSIYNISKDIYEQIKENTDIYVIEPVVKTISIETEGLLINYKCIQLRDLDKLFVEDQKITNVFAPSVAVNKTFEK